MIFTKEIKKIFFISLLLFFISTLFADFHPDIKWKEIKTKNFILVYPNSYLKPAIILSKNAESAYTKLSVLLGVKIKKRIRILLSDNSDIFISDSTIFPFSQIKINLAEPKPDRVYGSFKNSIVFFLTKELSKIFMSNIKGGPINFLRKFLGNHYYLSPMLLTPSPIIEGYSNFFALLLTKEVKPNEFLFTLESIANSRNFPQLSNLSGNYSKWPAKHSRHVFGLGFVLFLAENFPMASIIDLIKGYAKQPHKYRSTGAKIERFLSGDFDKLWNEFQLKYRNKKKNFKNIDFKIVDGSGMLQRYPVFIDNNQIIYLKNNFKESMQIILDNKKQESFILNTDDVSGISFDAKSNKLYYSASINSTPYYKYSEIFEYDLDTKKQEQLSIKQRLFNPIRVSKQNLLCVKRNKTKDYLAYFNIKTKKMNVFSKGFESLSRPVISPDHNYIACSIKNRNSFWQIGLFDINGKFIRYISDENKISYYPQWKDTNTLFYISEHKKNNVLLSYKIRENKYSIYNTSQNGFLKYFSFSNKKDKIAFILLKNNGYNTFAIEYSELSKIRTDYFKKNIYNKRNIEEKNHIKINKRTQKKYNIYRDLKPRYFSPTAANAGNEIQPGFITTGNDILNKHAYELNLNYGFIKKVFSYSMKYKYNGFSPNFSLSAFDKKNSYRNQYQNDFFLRTVGMQFLFNYPFIKTKNHQVYLAFDIHFEKISSDNKEDPNSESLFNFDLINKSYNGLGLSLIYNSSKEYYDSISQDDGIKMSLTFSKDIKSFGSEYNSKTLFFEYKHYISLFRPNVLSLRLAMIKSFGEFKRGVFMGGLGTIATTNPLKSGFLGLMRGFPSGYFFGTTGYLLNTEYRSSILKIENSILFLPYLERIYLTLFTDIGKLVIKEELNKPVISYGAEFNVKFNLGSPIIVAFGLAKGNQPELKTMFYIRFDHSF